MNGEWGFIYTTHKSDQLVRVHDSISLGLKLWLIVVVDVFSFGSLYTPYLFVLIVKYEESMFEMTILLQIWHAYSQIWQFHIDAHLKSP